MLSLGSFMLTRGVPDLYSGNVRSYGGTWFCVRFMVDKPILLRKIGFFGPAGEDCLENSASSPTQRQPAVTILVRLGIFQSSHHDTRVPDCLLDVFKETSVFEINVSSTDKLGQIFYVDLQTGVQIPAGIIMDIKFELNGKHRPIKFYRLPDSHPIYQSINHSETEVDWTFFNSSRQLASFEFSLVKPGQVNPQTTKTGSTGLLETIVSWIVDIGAWIWG